jgi:hypothetical protein
MRTRLAVSKPYAYAEAYTFAGASAQELNIGAWRPMEGGLKE